MTSQDNGISYRFKNIPQAKSTGAKLPQAMTFPVILFIWIKFSLKNSLSFTIFLIQMSLSIMPKNAIIILLNIKN